ncbi:MAG TPA: M56 family metallopeptidase [Candidatus Eisenbacteria bacterium]|nr:M56 family metallopeptidase [Candidatus Eisenbacteria bacterium]
MTPSNLLDALLRASVAGGIATTVAWLLLIFARNRVPASRRAWIWWLVAAQFLTAAIPAHRIVLPFSENPPAITSVAPPTRIVAAQTGVAAHQISSQILPAAPRTVAGSLALLVLAAWLLGVALAVVLHLRALRRIEGIWKAAEPYDPDPEEALVLRCGRSRRKQPEVRVTAELDVPVTLAGWMPRILLPAGYGELPSHARHLVLAHECAHVARRDLLLGWLPAATEVLFWFHPLARWSVREYGQAREEACDAMALHRTQASPRSYGELLVHFGVASRPIPSTASCGSPTRSALLRRLLVLDSHSSTWGRIAGAILIAVAVLSLAPLTLHAHDDRDSREDKGTPKSPAELEIERFAYLLVQPGGNTMSGAMKMGGGYNDHERAQAAQKRMGGGMIWWFRLDRTQYGVNDPETLASVRAVLQKQDELQRRMLEDFDHDLELLHGRMERLQPKVERLEHRTMQLEEDREALEEDRDSGKKSQAELQRRLQEIERSRMEIEREREPLARQQEEISRQMEAVTERREAVRPEWERQELELRGQLRRIAEDAVRRGVARKL